MVRPAGVSREEKRELLRALETLRGRLAVAVATERKRLTLGLWEEYLRTEERARGILRGLRGIGDNRGHGSCDEILQRILALPVS